MSKTEETERTNSRAAEMARLREELVKNIREDRGRLSEYVDRLLDAATGEDADPFALTGIAEYMAKLSDSLTKNNALLLSALAATAKEARISKEEREADEVYDDDGPFVHEAQGGSN